jgi:Mg2+ and Co2+ transporter CorA
VRSFRLETRQALETFLRFTHRYWFHVISNQVHIHDLFALCRKHLEVDRLYDEVREELKEMSEFLENEAMRRQNETMTRLTVVTTFGLIATVATGFLGMNLFDWAAQDGAWRASVFAAVTAAVAALTMLTVARSRRLADFLERLSDEGRARQAQRDEQKSRKI